MIIKITVTLAICLCSETLSVFFQLTSRKGKMELSGQICTEWCAIMLQACTRGRSLSVTPNEQISWRFIRIDIVLWIQGVRPLHYPSITRDVLQINYEATTSSCWEADPNDESESSPMAITAYTARSFSIEQSKLVSLYKGTHINCIASCGRCVWGCVENKHNLSPDMGWKVRLYLTSVLGGKVKRLFSYRAADVWLY